MVKVRKDKIINLTGIIMILLGLSISILHILDTVRISTIEEKAIEDFYTENNSNVITSESIENKNNTPLSMPKYIAVLNIPKINLKRGLVDKNSPINNVNYNIEILKDSSMPDEQNGNVILASHSGNSRISYFRHLNQLSINDEITIDYNNQTYRYLVKNIYEIEKTGTAKIIRNHNVSTLTLITCKHNTDKQIVIISELVV